MLSNSCIFPSSMLLHVSETPIPIKHFLKMFGSFLARRRKIVDFYKVKLRQSNAARKRKAPSFCQNDKNFTIKNA